VHGDLDWQRASSATQPFTNHIRTVAFQAFTCFCSFSLRGLNPFRFKTSPVHSQLGVSLGIDFINSKQQSLLMRKQPNYQRGHDDSKQNNTNLLANPRAINISKLKEFVAENFPLGSPLQTVFVGENNVISAEAFLAKLPLWLKLSKLTTLQSIRKP
jgi:hypothetical protein